jgi:hypothetical protein
LSSLFEESSREYVDIDKKVKEPLKKIWDWKLVWKDPGMWEHRR